MKNIKIIILSLMFAVIINITFTSVTTTQAGLRSFERDVKQAVKNNFNDNKQTLIEESFASAFGYQEIVEGQENPQNKLDFTAEIIARFVADVVAQQRAMDAKAKPALPDEDN